MQKLLTLTIAITSMVATSTAATPAARAGSTGVRQVRLPSATSSRLAFLETSVRLLHARLAGTHWRRAPVPAAARAHLQRVLRYSLRLVPHRGTSHTFLGQARLELRLLVTELAAIGKGIPGAGRRLASLATALGEWLRIFRGLANAG